MTLDPVLFAVWLVAWTLAVGLYVTRRAVVAWLTYLDLRKRPEFQTPEARAWLWQETLNRANGKQS